MLLLAPPTPPPPLDVSESRSRPALLARLFMSASWRAFMLRLMQLLENVLKLVGVLSWPKLNVLVMAVLATAAVVAIVVAAAASKIVA